MPIATAHRAPRHAAPEPHESLAGTVPQQRRARHTLLERPDRVPVETRPRPEAAVETTHPVRIVDRDPALRPIALPFPETAGLLIRHPASSALAVSCDTRGRGGPDAERFPCYAVISGHEAAGDHLWMTYREARRGGWVLAGDVHDLL